MVWFLMFLLLDIIYHNPKEPLKLSPVYLTSEAYGFIISTDSPFLHNLDIKLLEMKENGKIKEIEFKWLSYSKRKGIGSID